MKAAKAKADVDAQPGDHQHQCDGDQRHDRPRDVHPEHVGQHRLGLRGEQAVDPDLQRVVGHQRQQRGGEPPTAAEPFRDVGVERASAAHVLGHAGERDREDDQHRARGQVGDRRADATDHECQRRDARHDGEGSGGRHDQEDEAARTEDAAFELPLGRGGVADALGGGSGHGAPFPVCLRSLGS
jgi:hypothetical protein